MRRRSLPLLPAAALICLAPLAQQAFCCSCVRQPEPLVALGRADAVFSGAVVAVRDPHAGEATYSSIDPLLYSIAVNEVWKGDVGDTTVITTARESCSCGFPFQIGRTYIVYAYLPRTGDADWSTHLCTRTRDIERAGEDLEALNAVDTSGTAADADRRLVGAAIDDLRSEDGAVRVKAADALRDMGKELDAAIPALEEYYRRGTSADRRAAVDAIGVLGWTEGYDERTAPALLAALEDSDTEVITTASFRLSRMREQAGRVVPAMLNLLADDRPRVVDAALRALHHLARLEEPLEGVPSAILRTLKDPAPQVRSSALGLLSDIGPDSVAIGPLLAALSSDPHRRVRSSAAFGLGKLDRPTREAVDALTAALGDTSSKVRAEAANSLTQMSALAAGAVPALEEVALDEDRYARESALCTLATMAAEIDGALVALERLLDRGAEETREEVAARLGWIKVDAALVTPLLEKAMIDSSRAVRSRAVRSLGQLAGADRRAEELLVEAMADPSDWVRGTAAAVAGRLETPSENIVRALGQLRSDISEHVRESAAASLAKLNRTDR